MIIDVLNPAGNKQGDGPIINATSWKFTTRLNKAGNYSFAMPYQDERAALLQAKNLVRCYAVINGVLTFVGCGIVDQVDVSVTADGRVLTVTGDDQGRDLTNVIVGTIGTGAGPTHGVPDIIEEMLPAGWTMDPSPASTVKEFMHDYDGETVLEALIRCAELSGECFYIDAGNKIVYWLGPYTTFESSGVRAIQAINSTGGFDADTCFITSIKKTNNSFEACVGRVYAFGRGTGDAKITLEDATQVPPAGYSYASDPNKGYCLQHDATWAAYGIEIKLDAKDVKTPDELYEQAFEFLVRHISTVESYTIDVAKLETAVHPGQTIYLSFHGYTSTYQYVNIERDLNIVEVTTSIDVNGLITHNLVLSTIDIYPESEMGKLGDYLRMGIKAYTHDQGVSDSIGAVAAPNDSLYLTLGFDSDLVNERVLVAGDGLAFVDGGANGNYTLSVGAGSLMTLGVDTIGITPGADQNQVIVSGDHAGGHVAGWSSGYLSLAAAKTLTITDSLTNEGGNAGTLHWDAAATLTIAGNASINGTNTGDVTLATPNHGLSLTNQVIAMGTPSTLTSSTSNAVTTTTHTHAITGSPALLGNGTQQYQTIVTGATPFAPGFSGFLLDGTTGGKTILAVTNTKILTLTAADTYNLTIPATGTAALLGVANTFTQTQTISNSAPELILTDTTALAKSLTLKVDASVASWYESAGAAGDILSLDLANKRIGLGTISPKKHVDILSTSTQLRLSYTDNDHVADFTVADGGYLTIDPSGDILNLAASTQIQTANYVNQTTGWGANYAGDGDFRRLYADEMHVKAFIADLEQALAGGQIISKSVAPLAEDFTVPGEPVPETQFITFDGTTTVIDCGSDSGIDNLHAAAFTVEGWFNFDASDGSTFRPIFDKIRWYLNIYGSDKIYAEVQYLPDYAIINYTTTIIGDGNWHHIAITYDQTGDKKIRLWIDGDLKQTSGAASGTIRSDASESLYIASAYAGTRFKGKSGWLRISNLIRYAAGFTPDLRSTPPTVDGNTIAQWNLDEGSGTTIDNAEGTAARDGTITSGTWGTDAPGGGTATLVVEEFKGFDGSKVFEDGDIVRLRTFDRPSNFIGEEINELLIEDCWGTVVYDTRDGTNKTQTYTFTRSVSPNSGALLEDAVVSKGTMVLDYGVTGNGFLESNAIDGVMAENAPYHQIVSWTTHPCTGQVIKTRLGNLHGIFGVENEYGLFAGKTGGIAATDEYIRISDQGALLNNIALKLAGTTPYIAIGVTPPTAHDTGTGIWIDRTGLYGLLANAEQVKLDATTGAITAGDGHVVMDVGGLSIIVQSADAPESSLNFKNGAAIISKLSEFVNLGGASRQLRLEASEVVDVDSELQLLVYAEADRDAYITIQAGSTGTGCIITLDAQNSGGVNRIFMETGTVGVGTAWYVPQSQFEIRGPAGTGATSPAILTLSTKETTIVGTDQLGRINFNAPLEADGSDAILLAASIAAVAEATFTTTVNSTSLVFYTGASEAATEKARITSTGRLGLGTSAPDRKFEINSADGTCLRLTYNDSDGSAANYADFLVSSSGHLTITTSDTTADSTIFTNPVTFSGGITIADAKNIILNTTTGTIIGTATNQKLSFYNATPVVQGAHVTDADTNTTNLRNAINAVILRLETVGLIAAA